MSEVQATPMCTRDRLEVADQQLADSIIDENKEMQPKPYDAPWGRRIVGRAQHRKHHGCVVATFNVENDIPFELKKGVFAEPGLFKALIRFSSGNQINDNKKDVHGCAIKLLDVHGPRIDAQNWQTMQDFILVDDERFFTGNLVTYEVVNKIVADGINNILTQSPLHAVVKIITGLRLHELEHGEILQRLKDFTNQKPASPLSTHYWSTTPYSLGTKVVKYKLVCFDQRKSEVEDAGSEYLANTLVDEIGRADASFDFVVHVQSDNERHPIDDPSISWSENNALEVKLATIKIPRQVVEPNSELAERLVFSPWNCLAEHEPRGKINLTRRQVYVPLAQGRHHNEADWKLWSNGG